MCNDRPRFNSIKKLLQPIVIEFGDDNKVTVSDHRLVKVSQESEVNALYTPTFQLSLLSFNQLDTAGYTSTFGHGKCSISYQSITITGNRVNDPYIISSATALTSACLRSPLQEGERKRENEHHRVHTPLYHESRTPPSQLLAHSTLPFQQQPAPNDHLPPNVQSPLTQSLNPDCGIAV
jgi:hypothetical protein